MTRKFLMASGVLLAIGFTVSTAGAQCAFQHPMKAKEVRLPFVQAFIPCDGGTCVGGGWYEGAGCGSNADCPSQPPEPAFCYVSAVNSHTDIGVSSCKSPLTFNEAKGSPTNGWLWGPNSSGSVSFKAARNGIVNPLNPVPNTADVQVRIALDDIENANGLANGTGWLGPMRRTTFEDRAGGDMTVVDLNLPSFAVQVVGGRARVRTSANAWLNTNGFPGVPGCTSLELVRLELRDENNTLFGSPGIFLPDINPN